MISRLSAMFAAIACAATLAVSPLAAQAQDQAASAAASAADSAPAPADIAPAAVSEPAAAKPVENPYSLGNIVAHGNVVDQAVLAILAIMSMGSWYILFTKLWDTSKIAREAKEVRASFFKKASLQEGLKSLSETGAFRFIAQTGVEASEHHEGALTENIDHNTWVTMNIDRAVQEVNSRLQGGLGFLATVGSTSPVHRPVRYRVGHPASADADRRRRPSVDRQGRRPRGRRADHDRHRSGRGRSGRAGLQLAGQPQQVGHGPSPCLRC